MFRCLNGVKSSHVFHLLFGEISSHCKGISYPSLTTGRLTFGQGIRAFANMFLSLLSIALLFSLETSLAAPADLPWFADKLTPLAPLDPKAPYPYFTAKLEAHDDTGNRRSTATLYFRTINGKYHLSTENLPVTQAFVYYQDVAPNVLKNTTYLINLPEVLLTLSFKEEGEFSLTTEAWSAFKGKKYWTWHWAQRGTKAKSTVVV